MTIPEIVFDIIQKDYRGRENAITRDDLRERLELWDIIISDRKLRDIYSKLPICTCDQGVFYPVRIQEIEEYRQYLKSKAIPLFERWKMVAQAHPNLLSTRGRQMDLFEDAKNLF
jgi:hypothetical protein